MSTITRRRLLAGAAAASSALLLPARPWRALVDVVAPTPAARLGGLLRHGDGARAIGRVYLAGLERRPSRRDLVAAVTAGLPGGAKALEGHGDDELRGLIAGRVHDDFVQRATVDVDGWVLSCTEARLCALAELTARARRA